MARGFDRIQWLALVVAVGLACFALCALLSGCGSLAFGVSPSGEPALVAPDGTPIVTATQAGALATAAGTAIGQPAVGIAVAGVIAWYMAKRAEDS